MQSNIPGNGDWILRSGESFWGCMNPWVDTVRLPVRAYDHCDTCLEVPYRVIVINSEQGIQARGVAVCGRHFLEACQECHRRHGCELPANGRLDLQRRAKDRVVSEQ